jgi:hypothetical protein
MREMMMKRSGMMGAILAAAMGWLLAALPALAALPPWYQRIEEMRAVLTSGQVAEAFRHRGEEIVAVEYVEYDVYRVRTENCHMIVRIQSLPMPYGMVGARRFELRHENPECDE